MLTGNKANLRRPQQILPQFRTINRFRQGIVSVAMANHEIRRIELPQPWKQPGHGQSAVSSTLAHANNIRFFMEMITPPLGLRVFDPGQLPPQAIPKRRHQPRRSQHQFRPPSNQIFVPRVQFLCLRQNTHNLMPLLKRLLRRLTPKRLAPPPFCLGRDEKKPHRLSPASLFARVIVPFPPFKISLFPKIFSASISPAQKSRYTPAHCNC